jgi:hypothetical protein
MVRRSTDIISGAAKIAHIAIWACSKLHMIEKKTTFKIVFLVNLGLVVGEAEVADDEHVGVVPTAGPGEPQKVVFIIAVVIDDSLQSDCYQIWVKKGNPKVYLDNVTL